MALAELDSTITYVSSTVSYIRYMF